MIIMPIAAGQPQDTAGGDGSREALREAWRAAREESVRAY